ncbi:G-protein coupled receptor [Biomphalaria glabrata]|nr:G-protein coupled receptor [Biomphalaria glabrata]
MENDTLALHLDTTTTDNLALFICGMMRPNNAKYKFFHVFFCYINPIVAIAGLIFNTISLEILRCSGLNKPSTILLFSLVLTDSLHLLITLNFSKFVLFFGPNGEAGYDRCYYIYGLELNYFLAFSSNLFEFLGSWGRNVGSWIPLFITIERILAIFKPITFKSFVTPKRSIIVVISLFLFWLPYSIVIACYYKILPETFNGVSYVSLYYNDFLLENMDLIGDVQHWVADPLLSWFPLTFVTLGCTALIIKIRLALSKRRTLTSTQKSVTWSPRTTRTLLLTCLIFATTHSAASFLLYFYYQPGQLAIDLYNRNNLIFFFLNVNASSNLIVYISSNRKLFRIMLNIFHIRKKTISLKE